MDINIESGELSLSNEERCIIKFALFEFIEHSNAIEEDKIIARKMHGEILNYAN